MILLYLHIHTKVVHLVFGGNDWVLMKHASICRVNIF